MGAGNAPRSHVERPCAGLPVDSRGGLKRIGVAVEAEAIETACRICGPLDHYGKCALCAVCFFTSALQGSTRVLLI